jgi:hypothetical protein
LNGMSMMFLFPLSRGLGEGPSVYGGVSTLAFEAFLPSADGGHEVRDFRPQIPLRRGGSTSVRVVLARQRWLSMSRFSPIVAESRGANVQPHVSKPGTSKPRFAAGGPVTDSINPPHAVKVPRPGARPIASPGCCGMC